MAYNVEKLTVYARGLEHLMPVKQPGSGINRFTGFLFFLVVVILYPLYQVGHQKLLKNHLLCGNVGETIVRGFGVVVRGVCLPYTQV